MWLCKCDCGNEAVVPSQSLLSGKSKSCGCLKASVAADLKKIHGGVGTRLYTMWGNMKARTGRPSHNSYPNYGGRGIKVCDEWKSDFVAFRNWALAHGYDDSLSIDRIDNDGDYRPENCRFVDVKAQLNNTRRNLPPLMVNGEVHTAKEWSQMLGITYNTIFGRLKRGWPVERALGLVA